MTSKLIQLEDGTLVEVEVSGQEVQQIAGGLAHKVDATLSKINPILVKTCRPIADALKELRKEVEVECIEAELGLSFEGEGNLYVTKTAVTANLIVRLSFK